MHIPFVRITTLAAVTALFSACATGGTPGASGPAADNPNQTAATPSALWPIKTRHHVDLWLHGFAMIQDDTTQVPYFRRGYRAEMMTLRNRANATTQLDANRETLRRRFALNPQLVNAQFLPLYFDSIDEMIQAMDFFHRVEGEPRAAGNREAAEIVALLAGYFQTPQDRDWARLFVQSLRDENTRFYRAYWDQQQRERAGVLSAVENLWGTFRPRLQRFLSNTNQSAGEILLSLPLNGEGRTLSAGKRQNATAVTFPMRPADAIEAIYVITHELVGSLAGTAVNDNVTPNDRRAGLADRYIGAAAVRGGALLLQRTSPELVDGYARYYLRAANRSSTTANPQSALAQAFPLPEAIRDALSRQIDIVLSGI